MSVRRRSKDTPLPPDKEESNWRQVRPIPSWTRIEEWRDPLNYETAWYRMVLTPGATWLIQRGPKNKQPLIDMIVVATKEGASNIIRYFVNHDKQIERKLIEGQPLSTWLPGLLVEVVLEGRKAVSE